MAEMDRGQDVVGLGEIRNGEKAGVVDIGDKDAHQILSPIFQPALPLLGLTSEK